MNVLAERLAERGVLLADGATGTNLFAAGLATGEAPELWNRDRPDAIAALHRAFIDAGSDIVLTNSFGGNRYRLALHEATDDLADLNRRAATIARVEADRAARSVLVAGSMGPTGELVEPHGPLTAEACAAAFEEQARALAEGGADLLWLETLSSAEEISAALEGAARVGLPLVCTASLDTNGRTMMGLTGVEVYEASRGSPGPLAAVGTNCGVGAAEVVAAILAMHRHLAGADDPVPLVAKANAGIPRYVDGGIVYDGTPELMATYAQLARDAGAAVVGGCCGNAPAHIAAMRAALDADRRGEPPTLDAIVAALGEVSTGVQAQLRGETDVAAGSASGRGRRDSRRRPRRG